MIIGIDIRVLNNKTKSGIEEYTENLLTNMIPLDRSVKYKLFTSSVDKFMDRQNWLSEPNTEVHKYNIPNKFLFFSANFNFPYIDKVIGGADVFFSPHFFLTSLSPACRRVTTFHDLSYLRFPEFFSWRKRLWHTIEMKPKWQAKFSDKIISVSESTKSDLVDLYQIDPAKIKVIYSGIATNLKKLTDPEVRLFRKENNLPDKFILFLGKLEPRKNIVALIKAFEMLRKEEEFKELHLVIVGSRGWLEKDIFREGDKNKNDNDSNNIIFTDYIRDELRAGYYSCASVFIYPSFFEGFGFPPLEAMACGTPVIISSNSSLPEVGGKAGIYIDPTNIYEMYSTIRLILSNRELQTSIVYEGYKKSENFNWKKTAEETLDYLLK